MTHHIETAYDPKPIPSREFDWTATWDDYDGAEDSKTRSDIGYGPTEDSAIADLIDITGRRDDEPVADYDQIMRELFSSMSAASCALAKASVRDDRS